MENHATSGSTTLFVKTYLKDVLIDTITNIHDRWHQKGLDRQVIDYDSGQFYFVELNPPSYQKLHLMARKSRVEAWEERNPGEIRVLLSNPGWEGRLLRFLELSGVGRFVEVGVDEDEAYASRMDVGGGRGDGTRGAIILLGLFYYLVVFSVCIICKGDPYPENSAQRRLGAEDFLCLGVCTQGRRPVSLVFVYMPLWGERTVKRE
jgi:hypothetical protein